LLQSETKTNVGTGQTTGRCENNASAASCAGHSLHTGKLEMSIVDCTYYTVSQKVTLYEVVRNFAKYWPTLKILLLTDLAVNLQIVVNNYIRR